MRLLDALSAVSAIDAPVFHTRDAAASLDVSPAHASTILARLAAAGHLMGLRRGVWGFRDRIDPLALPEHLTSPFPAYVSLQSALYLHGMIAQVPSVTYAVSLARTRRYPTPLGTVSVHHVEPRFFFGFEQAGRRGGRLATPEKALVDFLYLRPARSKLFRALPELEWPRTFRARAAWSIVARIEPARRRTSVSRALEQLLGSRGEVRSR
jgi:predicted transcriptional regulator of viral defense system